MALADTTIRSTKPGSETIKMSDGGGLSLLVRPSGKKTWQLQYRFEGRQRAKTLGDYPRISLATARAMRGEVKDKIAAGINPSLGEGEVAEDDKFETIARRWLAGQKDNWVPAHYLRVSNRLTSDVLPEIGNLAVDKIRPSQITAMLRKVEDRNALDVARRVRQTVSAIFRFAIAEDRLQHDPAATVIDAMRPRPKRKHNPYLRDTQLPAFLSKLDTYSGGDVTRLGIEFLLLTMVRTKEARFAKKSEFSGNVWRIPADRMKMGIEHLVPISPQTRRVLDQLRALNNSEWLLPGPYHGKPISENTMIAAIYRMGYKGRLTVHGLRRTASTMLNESGLFHFDAIERQLAHVPEDEVRAAYNAAQYMPVRVKMMTWWGERVDAARRSADTDLSDLLGVGSSATDITDLLV